MGTKYENKQHNRTSKHMLSYISPQIIATKSEVTCCLIDGLQTCVEQLYYSSADTTSRLDTLTELLTDSIILYNCIRNQSLYQNRLTN